MTRRYTRRIIPQAVEPQPVQEPEDTTVEPQAFQEPPDRPVPEMMMSEFEAPAPPVVEAPPPQLTDDGKRVKYGSFREAWLHVLELRRYTVIEARPRFNMSKSDMTKAKQLIEEYKNG